jgi:cytochrome b
VNTASASPADRPDNAAQGRRILVWDLPVRVFHWLAVLSFGGAWITAESERWRLLHVTLGYTLAGLVAFRLVWGLVGTRHARFASFVRGPGAVLRYLRSLLSAAPEHHTGHNPAGAWVILALLALPLGIVASGWAIYHDIGGSWLEETHELLASAMLAIVGAHVLGVIVSSFLHGENLVAAMVSGCKTGHPKDAVRSAWRSVAAIMLVAIAALWWVQWQSAPAVTAGRSAAHATPDDDD